MYTRAPFFSVDEVTPKVASLSAYINPVAVVSEKSPILIQGPAPPLKVGMLYIFAVYELSIELEEDCIVRSSLLDSRSN